MGRKKSVIDEQLVTLAETEFDQLAEGKLAMQLRAIISSGKHPVDQVAEIFGVNRRSIFRWAGRFKKGGVTALRDRPRGHRRGKLTDEQQATMAQWIINGTDAAGQPTRWTLGKLRRHLERQCQVKISLTPLANLLHRKQLALKRPRPLTPKPIRKNRRSLQKKTR